MIQPQAARGRRSRGNSATGERLCCCGTARREDKHRTGDPLLQSIVPADRAAMAANESAQASAPAATFLLAPGRAKLFLRRAPRCAWARHSLPAPPHPESAPLVSTEEFSEG